jgi:hypothetical protein
MLNSTKAIVKLNLYINFAGEILKVKRYELLTMY